jgi:hypothetical protein
MWSMMKTVGLGVVVGTSAMMMSGCATGGGAARAMSAMAPGDKMTLESIDLSQAVSNRPPVSNVKLTYERGTTLDLRFSSKRYKIENMEAKGEPGSGVLIEDGAVRVNATGVKPLQAMAPRFWPIIRRQRVSVGAEGTEFVVEAVNQVQPDGRTLIVKVQMIGGTKVLIDAPDATAELKDPGSQAFVYLRRDNKHDIEVQAQMDAQLQSVVQELSQ